jgi:hypothetical protein
MLWVNCGRVLRLWCRINGLIMEVLVCAVLPEVDRGWYKYRAGRIVLTEKGFQTRWVLKKNKNMCTGGV